jgi:hypothetical protein
MEAADLISLTDLLWQYWQLVVTALCFYFGHISRNKTRELVLPDLFPLAFYLLPLSVLTN